jgi:DNA-binding MarR family transcriptional regulator
MIESAADFPAEQSIGYLIRSAQRAYIQDLQARLAPYGISVGMWFFLRALFHEDGITQRALSARVGLMDPTTVEQIKNMEARGYIVRRRSTGDKRKINVYLTAKGRALQKPLMPHAVGVNETALVGLSPGEVGFLRLVLLRIIGNLKGAAAADPARRPAKRRSRRKALASAGRKSLGSE